MNDPYMRYRKWDEEQVLTIHDLNHEANAIAELYLYTPKWKIWELYRLKAQLIQVENLIDWLRKGKPLFDPNADYYYDDIEEDYENEDYHH